MSENLSKNERFFVRDFLDFWIFLLNSGSKKLSQFHKIPKVPRKDFRICPVLTGF